MDERQLESLLSRFCGARILVVGDYFLDHYLMIDRALSEVSIETGLEAYQVTEIRNSPGAAGTVTSNLRALGVHVVALGVIGHDGSGYDLQRGLEENGVDTAPLIRVQGRYTPTYTKPMVCEQDGRIHEIERLDIKNRTPLPHTVETQVIERLHGLIADVDGVIVADQVPERNCGGITDRVRAAICELGLAWPSKVVAADSRVRIGEYRNVILKPNTHEAIQASQLALSEGVAPRVAAEQSGLALAQRSGKAVFLTMGADGILVCDQEQTRHVPGIQVSGPIDIVGAGDSTMAGIVSALCCGATLSEAAMVGNLVASITIQQIGATGTATRRQVLDRYRETMV